MTQTWEDKLEITVPKESFTLLINSSMLKKFGKGSPLLIRSSFSKASITKWLENNDWGWIMDWSKELLEKEFKK